MKETLTLSDQTLSGDKFLILHKVLVQAHLFGLREKFFQDSIHRGGLVLVVDGSLLSLEEVLAVSVLLERSDEAVGSGDWDLSLLTVGLFLNDFLNVEASSSTVDRGDFTFTALVAAAHDLDLVTLSDWNASHTVLLF